MVKKITKKPVKKARKTRCKARKRTSDEISTIASEYSKHPDPKVRRMSMSLISQDEHEGKRGTKHKKPLTAQDMFMQGIKKAIQQNEKQQKALLKQFGIKIKK